METTITGNLDIKNEPIPGGMFSNTTSTTAARELFGNTTPSQAPKNPAVAAKDPTRSTTEQTSAQSNRQEEQEFTNAMPNSITDTTTVTPSINASTLGEKRERGSTGSKRRG
jgi:hypothetical protein